MSVSGQQPTENVVLSILSVIKQLFISIIKCKTGDIDRRHHLRSYDRSTADRSSASVWPGAGFRRLHRHNGTNLASAAHDTTSAACLPVSRPLPRTAAFHAIGMVLPDCRIECLQTLEATLRTLRRASRCAKRCGDCRIRWAAKARGAQVESLRLETTPSGVERMTCH